MVQAMSKPYSETEFVDQITRDRTWRLKEITDLKTAIVRADANLQSVLLRSIVTICYAHWEGYIRFSATKYLEHVAIRKLKFGELNSQFTRNYFLPRLTALSKSNSNYKENCDLIDNIQKCTEKRFTRVNEDLVNTKSNLNFSVFLDICLVCAIPSDQFQQKKSFIDVVLLKRRNSIAHGEDTFINIDDLDEIVNETVSIMRGFGNALENSVLLKEYRAA